MVCAAALQKRAGSGLLAMTNDMGSKEGGFEIEVWAADRGPVEMVEACKEKKKHVSKKTLAGKVRPHRHSRGNENMEPFAQTEPVEMVEACREKKKGVSKKILAGKVCPHRLAQAKENLEPSGHVDMVEACREMGGIYGISKKRLTERTHLQRHFQDKENVNPSGSDFCPSPLPSWHRRYPLQDITTLIHSLQGLQVDIDAGLASSGLSELEELMECWHMCKDANKNTAQLLWMR